MKKEKKREKKTELFGFQVTGWELSSMNFIWLRFPAFWLSGRLEREWKETDSGLYVFPCFGLFILKLGSVGWMHLIPRSLKIWFDQIEPSCLLEPISRSNFHYRFDLLLLLVSIRYFMFSWIPWNDKRTRFN